MPLAALLLGACSTSSSAVLTVDGRQVSASELKKELSYFAGNKKFVDAVGGVERIGKVGDYKSDFVANVLTNDLYGIVIEQEALARGAKPVAATKELRAEVASSMGGEDALAGFPSVYQEALVRRRLLVAGLTNVFVKQNDPKKYFDDHQAEFGSSCISHILVASKEGAAAARARIVAGEDFAKVAKELSTDTGSKDTGGVLPCGNTAQYVAPFAAAAGKLKVNELSQPVQTDFGFHIIKVTKRDEPTYDAAAKTQATTAVTKLADTQLTEALTKRLSAAKIKVDPQYGVLNPTGSGGLPVIDPKAATPNAKLVKPGSSSTEAVPSTTTA